MKKLLIINLVFILVSFNTFSQWYLQNPYPTANSFNSVELISENVGWAVGTAGTIMKTSDSGVTWEFLVSGTKVELTDVFFINVNKGWVIGAEGTILITSDGGTNWTPQVSGVSNYLHSLSFADSIHGSVVGQSGLMLKDY